MDPELQQKKLQEETKQKRKKKKGKKKKIKENEGLGLVGMLPYDIKPVETIYFADGLRGEPRKITIKELEEIAGFQWTDNMLGPKKMKEYIEANKDLFELSSFRSLYKQTEAEYGRHVSEEDLKELNAKNIKRFKSSSGENGVSELLEVLKNSNRNDCVVIRKLNSNIKFAVFPKEGSVFQKNTIISGFYAGEYKESDRTSNSQKSFYQLLFDYKYPIFATEPGGDSLNGVVDAERFGNISRFINDAPESGELDKFYKVNPEIRPRVLTANLEKITIEDELVYPLNCLKTTEKIDSSTIQFVYDYGFNYWIAMDLLGVERRFFYKSGNKAGELVEKEHYKPKFLCLKIISEKYPAGLQQGIFINDLKNIVVKNKLSKAMESSYTFDELIFALVKKFWNLDVIEEDIYKARFICRIRLIVEEFLLGNAFDKDSSVKQKVAYVNEISSLVKNIKDFTDVTINKISESLQSLLSSKEKGKFYKENLGSLRKEIFLAISKFDEDKTKVETKSISNSEQSVSTPTFG